MSSPDWNLAQVLVGVFTLVVTVAVAPPAINFLAATIKSLALGVRRVLRSTDFVWQNQNQEPIVFSFFKWLKQGKFVRKPKDLDLGTKYIRTDPIVLKAAVFFFRFLAGGEYHESGPRIVIEDVGSNTTGYITPGLLGRRRHIDNYRIELTKKELEHILDGYPPWYSEDLLLVNGSSITHPIKSIDDVARGGWIVAVGLGTTLPAMQQCLKRGLPSEENYYPALTRAFERISHGLRNTQKAFPVNSMVKEALRLVEIMRPRRIEQFTLSQVYALLVRSKLAQTFRWDRQGYNCSWVDDDVKDYASGLRTEQCTMAIEAFNHYEDQLSEEEVKALEPILLVVLRAVLVGCYQVIKYFSIREHFEDVQLVKVLKELENKRKPIYLREWRIGDEE